jgi:hypothetical protein
MKQHKTLLASAVVLALGLSSFAIAERPPQCDQAEEAIRALGVEPGDLAQVEFSEMPPPEGASEEEHAAFDDMLDNKIADAFFGGDTEAAAAMFEQLDQFDVNPEDCGYFPPGMTAEMMQQGSGPDDQGMNDEGMHDDGMHDDGLHDQGMNDEGMHDDGMHDQGMHEQGMNDDGMHDQGMTTGP